MAMKNCAINGCESRGHDTCPLCAHWTPSRSHRYYYCIRYREERITCDLPKSSCKTCPFHDKEDTDGIKGRPNASGRDWRDPEERKEYQNQQRKSRTLEEKEEQIQELKSFLARLKAKDAIEKVVKREVEE